MIRIVNVKDVFLYKTINILSLLINSAPDVELETVINAKEMIHVINAVKLRPLEDQTKVDSNASHVLNNANTVHRKTNASSVRDLMRKDL